MNAINILCILFTFITCIFSRIITENTVEYNRLSLVAGHTEIGRGVYWSIVDNILNGFAGTLENRGDFYISSSSPNIGLQVEMVSGLGSIINHGLMSINSIASKLIPSHVNFAGKSFENHGRLYLGSASSILKKSHTSITTPQWLNKGTIILYQENKYSGKVKFGAIFPITNEGLICLYNQEFVQTTRINGFGCIIANKMGRIELLGRMHAGDQTFVLGDKESVLSVHASLGGCTYKVAGFGNGNIILLESPLVGIPIFGPPAFDYDPRSGILTLRTAILSQRFSIGKGYNPALFLVTNDSDFGIEGILGNAITYSGPIPAQSRGSGHCGLCNYKFPVAPGSVPTTQRIKVPYMLGDDVQVETEADVIVRANDEGHWYTTTIVYPYTVQKEEIIGSPTSIPVVEAAEPNKPEDSSNNLSAGTDLIGEQPKKPTNLLNSGNGQDESNSPVGSDNPNDSRNPALFGVSPVGLPTNDNNNENNNNNNNNNGELLESNENANESPKQPDHELVQPIWSEYPLYEIPHESEWYEPSETCEHEDEHYHTEDVYQYYTDDEEDGRLHNGNDLHHTQNEHHHGEYDNHHHTDEELDQLTNEEHNHTKDHHYPNKEEEHLTQVGQDHHSDKDNHYSEEGDDQATEHYHLHTEEYPINIEGETRSSTDLLFAVTHSISSDVNHQDSSTNQFDNLQLSESLLRLLSLPAISDVSSSAIESIATGDGVNDSQSQNLKDMSNSNSDSLFVVHTISTSNELLEFSAVSSPSDIFEISNESVYGDHSLEEPHYSSHDYDAFHGEHIKSSQYVLSLETEFLEEPLSSSSYLSSLPSSIASSEFSKSLLAGNYFEPGNSVISTHISNEPNPSSTISLVDNENADELTLNANPLSVDYNSKDNDYEKPSSIGGQHFDIHISNSGIMSSDLNIKLDMTKGDLYPTDDIDYKSDSSEINFIENSSLVEIQLQIASVQSLIPELPDQEYPFDETYSWTGNLQLFESVSSNENIISHETNQLVSSKDESYDTTITSKSEAANNLIPSSESKPTENLMSSLEAKPANMETLSSKSQPITSLNPSSESEPTSNDISAAESSPINNLLSESKSQPINNIDSTDKLNQPGVSSSPDNKPNSLIVVADSSKSMITMQSISTNEVELNNEEQKQSSGENDNSSHDDGKLDGGLEKDVEHLVNTLRTKTINNEVLTYFISAHSVVELNPKDSSTEYVNNCPECKSISVLSVLLASYLFLAY